MSALASRHHSEMEWRAIPGHPWLSRVNNSGHFALVHFPDISLSRRVTLPLLANPLNNPSPRNYAITRLSRDVAEHLSSPFSKLTASDIRVLAPLDYLARSIPRGSWIVSLSRSRNFFIVTVNERILENSRILRYSEERFPGNKGGRIPRSHVRTSLEWNGRRFLASALSLFAWITLFDSPGPRPPSSLSGRGNRFTLRHSPRKYVIRDYCVRWIHCSLHIPLRPVIRTHVCTRVRVLDVWWWNILWSRCHG